MLVAALLLAIGHADAERSPYDWARIRLDYARQEKVEQLGRFMGRIRALAQTAAADALVQTFFKANLDYAKAQRQATVPASLTRDVEAMRAHFTGYYIERYFAFYDVLFLEPDGRVFYTLRKEPDLHQDLASGEAAQTPLGRCIAQRPEYEAFVDFHAYGPSDEPAAFFVEPVRDGGAVAGWIALQLALNKVNSLFAGAHDLGATGETFLVNRQGTMLTESYFDASANHLDKQLAPANVAAKFAAKQGHRTVVDYRGATALTSFEVFEHMGTEWLVVAKIDRGEVSANHYADHRRFYAERLLEALRARPVPAPRPKTLSGASARLRIDLDEFLRADGNACLETWGVAECTALLVAFPGRFGYLAHISPHDRLYGGSETDLLAQMLRKVKTFDIRPCELGRVCVVYVAPHLNTLPRIIDELLAQGLLLSQLHVLCHPQAKAAAVRYDCGAHALEASWKRNNGKALEGIHTLEDAANLGRIFEGILEEDRSTRPQ